MEEGESRLRREELVAHREFVRALARRLMLDPDRGDDVAQETLLAALKAGPRPRGPMRRWLSGVVRNLAYRMLRSDDRRRRREASRARQDPARATGDVVADLELHRELVDALLTLEEPYRTTLLLHFFEDLPPSEIAKRRGLPGATVRSHLKRGIERLRRSLDERRGGRAWCLALLPLAFPAEPGAPLAGATTAGAIVMSAKSKLSIAALLLLALGAVPVALHWTARPASEGSPRAAGARIPANEVVADAGGGAGAASQPTFSIDVRVLGPDGTPVPGASVLVFLDSFREWPQGFASTGQAWFQLDWRTATGAPAPILEQETDGSGVARLDVAPGKSFRAEARKAGYSRGQTTLYYLSKPPERPIEIRLFPAHGLAGKVVDPEGRPVAGAAVAVGGADLTMHGGFVSLPHRITADEEGRYRFDALAAGDVSLWAALPGGVPACVAIVRVPDVDTFDIVLEPGGTLAGKVTEKGTGRPLGGIEVKVKIDGPPRAFGRGVTDETGVYEIRALPPGQVSALFAYGRGHAQEPPADPRSWISPQIFASETTVQDLEVATTGALHGTVRGDGPLPGAIVEAMCKIRYDYAIFQARTDERGAYRIEDLPPAGYLVRAATRRLHEPGSSQDLPFQAFEPGNDGKLLAVPSGGDVERSFVLEEGSGVVEGRVEDGNGVGLPGAKVGAISAETVTGPSGTFRLEGCVPGEHVSLAASLEGYRMAEFSYVAVKPQETARGVLLRLVPEKARELVGRIRPAVGTELREPYVLVRRFEESTPMWRGNTVPARHAAAADGTFRVEVREDPARLKGLLVQAGDIGAGLSEPVRVEIGEATRYEVELSLAPSRFVAGVVLGDDGQSVRGACVSLFEPGPSERQYHSFADPHAGSPVVAVSDAHGLFEVRGLAAGRYEFRVWARGWIDAVGQVAVPAEPQRIMLERAREIAGRVVTRDGKPVGRIYLWLQLPMPPRVSSEEWQRSQPFHNIINLCTNERSEFRVGGLKKGDYLINVGGGSGGPNVVSRAFEGIPAGTTDLELVVEPGLAIQGRVVNRSGEGLAGIDVSARIEGKEMVGDSRRSDTTGPDGNFEVTGVEAGAYSLWMRVGRGRSSREVTHEHVPAGSRGIVIEVDDAFASVSGTLVDGGFRPLGGVQLRISKDGRWSMNRAVTDAAGRYFFEGLEDATYVIRLDDDRYEALLLEGGESVRARATAVTLRLHEGAAVEGSVRDEAGTPLAGVWVGVKVGENWRAADTDAEGRFRVVGLPDGADALLHAAHEEFAVRLRRVRTGMSGATLTLLRGAITTGRLLDTAGQPVASVRLVFTPVDGDDTEASALTKEDGRFEVRLLDREYRVAATWRGELDAETRSCGALRGGGADVTLTAK